MKKILITFLLIAGIPLYGQVPLVNIGTKANDNTGDPLRTAFQKVNVAIGQINLNTTAIGLRAPIANAALTGLTKINALKVGTVKTGAQVVQIDSITSDGTNIYFYSGALILTAVPGMGGAAWGTITGTLADQVDLQSALNLKVGYPGAGIPLSTGAAWGTSITDNSTNWNTAYTDRLKWDGGSTGLVAATGRTSLGATTVGNAFFLMPNPSAITFPRINADNTITNRSAANLKADLGATLVGDALFTLPAPSAIRVPLINADNTVTATATTGTGNVVLSAAPTLTGLLKADSIEVESSRPGWGSIYGLNTSTTSGSMGVMGVSTETSGFGTYYGLYGLANGTAASATKVGVYGEATGGITNYAGYFNGDIGLNDGNKINFYNDVTLTHSANTLTLAGGNLALGANNLTMTGSLGATGAGKLTKVWSVDGEFTNLPTINGGTFKTALSLTSADVSLGNLTNKLQVEAEDSTGSAALTYLTGYQGSLKVPYSNVDNEDINLEGGLTSTSVTTGSTTVTTATITNATISGEFDAIVNSDDINWIPGTIIDPTNYEMIFEIDSTANAPVAGDSLYTDARFADMHVDVWRSNSDRRLELLKENYYEDAKYSYEFVDGAGVFTFHPVFATADVVRIVGSNSSLWTTLTPPAAAYHADYQAVYDAWTTKPSEAVAGYGNAFVTSLDTLDYWDGVNSMWDRLDLLEVYGHSINSASEALIWWNDPTQYGTAMSSPTWTTSQGYTGNATSSYVSTGINLSSETTNYTQDDATIFIYILDNQQEDVNVFAANGASAQTRLKPRGAIDASSARINHTSDLDDAGNTNSSGLWILTRTASNVIKLYRNGVLIDTEADISAGLPDATLLVLRSTSTYSDHQVAMIGVCDGINHDDEAAALTTIVEAFADSMGFGVIP